MLTVHRRATVEVSDEEVHEKKLEIAEQGWRSCEILALPCHSVSVVRFYVKKVFTKV